VNRASQLLGLDADWRLELEAYHDVVDGKSPRFFGHRFDKPPFTVCGISGLHEPFQF
jgi:hypothetical protein